MSHRIVCLLGALAVVIAVTAPVPVAGQAAASRPKTSPAPKTPWGDPDLQGIWNASGATPFERPSAFKGRDVLTDDEVAALEDEARRGADRPPRKGDPGAYNEFWFNRGKQTKQTSMIVDPPDGRLPPLTAEGQAAKKNGVRGANSWEDRHLWERCITRGGLPNAMFPRAYNNNAHILQAPGYVAIVMEQIHEARIIPLDRRPHVSQNIRQWLGDSRGHWEGNTLVVVTTNLADKVSALQPWADFNSWNGSGETLRLVERFTRVGADTIAYRVTVEDPKMYTRPWTVAFPMTKSQEQIYEYACHEGNYAMEGILAGARADEKAAQEAAKKGTR